MSLETIILPAVLPVSATDLFNWLQDDPTATLRESKYQRAIQAAVDDFELQASLRIVFQRVRWRPWRFGNQDDRQYRGYVMKVPLGNTGTDTVTINYVDSDGVTTAFTDFTVTRKDNTNSEIVLDSGAEWPTDVDCETEYPITVEFDCGWPTGNEWASQSYTLGTIVIPTYLKQTGAAYVVRTAGTSGANEPAWDTETGSTQTDGTVTWECLGATVPTDIKAAVLARATEKCLTEGIVLRGDPNMNLMSSNWADVISNRKLQW
jgi:hypothetical protein